MDQPILIESGYSEFSPAAAEYLSNDEAEPSAPVMPGSERKQIASVW